MRSPRRLLSAAVVAATVSAAVGCGASSTGSDPWSSCPETPIWNRNLDGFPTDFPDDTYYATPEDAVRAAVGDAIEITDVRPRGVWAAVAVRHDDEVGEFQVEQLWPGWVVAQGEGCAAWPAGEALMDFGDCLPEEADLSVCVVDPDTIGRN